MNSDCSGKYTIAANNTAEIAPDAPRHAYSGLLRCLYYVPAWLINRPARYSTTNRTVPM